MSKHLEDIQDSSLRVYLSKFKYVRSDDIGDIGGYQKDLKTNGLPSP